MYHHISDMNLKTFEDINHALAPYIPAVHELTGKDVTLKRMHPLMELLGHPEQQLRIIHIAGTSGKTSTAYFITELLMRAGKKVGLTVSPYVQRINERVQINLVPVPEGEFAGQLAEFLEIIKKADPQPTYMELLIAFAYWYFAKIGVDYAVIETGMGGLHDATNIAGAEDKVCVITDIGIDHTHILGDTIPEIAAQKAGIIYPRNHVFMLPQAPEVMDVFQHTVLEKQAILNVLSNKPEYQKQAIDFPLYQQRNWLLACQVVAYIAKRDSFDEPDYTVPPHSVIGRMQKVTRGDTTIILDGAHNEQKMQAFVDSFKAAYPNQKVPILLGLKQGKECETVLAPLRSICSEIIITTFGVTQTALVKPMDPHQIAKVAKHQGFSVTLEPDYKKALRLFLDQSQDVKVVTGSFYLVGQVLSSLS